MSEDNQNKKQQNINVTQFVDVDDLVWQLGQNVVEKIGYEKVNSQIQHQFQQQKNDLEEFEQYKQSNEKLDIKNKELSETLKQEREERKKIQDERDSLQAEIDRRDKKSGKKV